jgi:phytanoyl-CoA dioxygenase PhyH
MAGGGTRPLAEAPELRIDGLAPGAAASVFDMAGVTLLEHFAPAAWVARARAAVMGRLASVLDVIRASGRELGLWRDGGFAEVVQRSPGRYDVALDDPALHFEDTLDAAPSPLRALLDAILGKRWRATLRGAVVALPGAEGQPWHIDGEHLFGEIETPLPAHAVTLFVPLVDVTLAHGPTEVAPGSHRPGRGTFPRHEEWSETLDVYGYHGTPVSATIRAGACLLLDYRTLHRALPNRSAAPRPVLYVVAARPWYADVTFPARRLEMVTRVDGV